MLASLSDSARHADPRIRERPGLLDDGAVQRFLGGSLADLVTESCDRLLARRGGN